MEIIKTVDLHKSFGDLHVLTGVNETIHKGEVVSIIGPSGGGKSTFLRCLNLLEKPEQGQIFFNGEDITGKNVNIDIHRQKMGMVFQQFNVFPHLTVAENITMAPKMLKGMSQADADAMAKDLLARVGLLDKFNEFVSAELLVNGHPFNSYKVARLSWRYSHIIIANIVFTTWGTELEDCCTELVHDYILRVVYPYISCITRY